MAIKFSCPHCRKALNVKDHLAGKKAQCPACKKPVRRLFSTFNSPKALSISDAKKAGFNVLKRVSKGEYERQ